MIQVSGFKPYGERVLVKPLPKKEKIGNILIADTVVSESEEAEVIAVGDTVSNGIVAGITVLYSSKAGWEIEVKGVKMKVLREPEIEGEVI